MTDPNLPLLELRSALLDWWEHYGRHTIPWKLRSAGEPPDRDELLDPYRTWVAEVMLQQTQLQVVLPYWQRWMQAFPINSSNQQCVASATATASRSPVRANQ